MVSFSWILKGRRDWTCGRRRFSDGVGGEEEVGVVHTIYSMIMAQDHIHDKAYSRGVNSIRCAHHRH